MSFVVDVVCEEEGAAIDVVVPEVDVLFEDDVVVVEGEVVVEVDCGNEVVFLDDVHSGANLPGSSPISRLGLVELETRALSEIRNSGLDADMEELPTRFTWKATQVESSTNGAQRGARFDEQEQGTSFRGVEVSGSNDDGSLWRRSEVLRGEGRGGDFRSGAYGEVAVESFLRAMEDERISGEVRREGPKNLGEALEFAVQREERASSRINRVEVGETSSVENVVESSWAEMCEEERRGAATNDDVMEGGAVFVNTMRGAVSTKKAYDASMFAKRQQAKERRLPRAGRTKTTRNSGCEEKN